MIEGTAVPGTAPREGREIGAALLSGIKTGSAVITTVGFRVPLIGGCPTGASTEGLEMGLRAKGVGDVPGPMLTEP